MKIHHYLKKLLLCKGFSPALTLMAASLALPIHAESFTVDGVDQPWDASSGTVRVDDAPGADTSIAVEGIDSKTSALYTGYSTGGEVSGNSLGISNSNLKVAYGAYITGKGTAHDNSLTLDNATFSERIYGVELLNKDAKDIENIENTVVATHNSLTIRNTNTLVKGAVAARAVYGTLEYNSLLVENANINIPTDYELIAAYLNTTDGKGAVRNNTLTIRNSTINGPKAKILAATSRSGRAEHNTLIIENSTIDANALVAGNVAGNENGKALHNTVILRGECTIHGTIYVGDAPKTDDEYEVIGNTLRLEGFKGEVTKINNYESINITLSDWDPSETMLKTQTPLDLEGVTVTLEGIESIAAGATLPKVGEELLLFSNTTNEDKANLNIQPEYRNIRYGATRLVDLRFDVDETSGDITFDSQNGRVGEVVRVRANPQLKALAEGRVAALAFANRAGNLTAEQGMEQAGRAASDAPEGSRLTAFMAMSAGHDKVDSGSHVDADGVATMLGVSSAMLREKALTLGGFIEGGWGQYTTHNSFADVLSVRGTGESSYVGGGVLARYAFRKGKVKGLALEASLRAGKQDTDFSGSDRNGAYAGYELSSSYVAGHLGANYTFAMGKRFENMVYARYLWSYLGSDHVSLGGGESMRFDAAHSDRLRFGARTAWRAFARWTPYAGLAYEWECNGNARSVAAGERVDAPSMRGGSVIAELGTTWQPKEDKPLWVNAGIQGSAGKTQGYGANIGCTIAF